MYGIMPRVPDELIKSLDHDDENYSLKLQEHFLMKTSE